MATHDENEEQEVLQRGIAAFQAGNMSETRKLMTSILQSNNRNETAWLYLARAQSDTAKRRLYYEKLLKLNPSHPQANAEIDEAPQAASPGPAGGASAAGQAKPRERVVTAEPVMNLSGGVRVPPGIPDAPERLTPTYVSDFVQSTVQSSLAVLRGGADPLHLNATWWRVVFTTGLVGLVIGLTQIVAYLITYLRFPFGFNLLYVITQPFLMILLTLVAVGAGVFLSHWYLTTQAGGRSDLLHHATAMVAVWTPLTIILCGLQLIEVIMGTGGTSIISIMRGGGVNNVLTAIVGGIVVVFAILLASQLIRRLWMTVPERAMTTAAAVMFFVTAFVMTV